MKQWRTLRAKLGHEIVTIEILTTPTRVDLLFNGEMVNELPIVVEKSESLHHLTAIAPGYRSAELTLRANKDQQLFINLKKK